jgi:urease subunit gamma
MVLLVHPLPAVRRRPAADLIRRNRYETFVRYGVGDGDRHEQGGRPPRSTARLRRREDIKAGDMNLAPSEVEKLLMSVAGMVARDRLSRGVKLNYPESVALLSTWVIERAREGGRVDELMASGRGVLTRDDVMDGVAEMLSDVQVEATCPDGRKLVTLHQPIQ